MSQGERFPVTRPEVEHIKMQLNQLTERLAGLGLKITQLVGLTVGGQLENCGHNPVETKPSESPIRVQAERGIPDLATRMSFNLGGRETGRPSDNPQSDSTEPAR